MDESIYRTVVKEQKEDIDRMLVDDRLVIRDGLDSLKGLLDSNLALINTGIRRCGKSTFSILMVKDRRYGYVNFDDERLMGMGVEDLNKVLESIYSTYGDPDYLVLDEVQNVKGWELFVNRLLRSKKVIITGSSARLMSKELATHMTGRHIDFILHPFSFKEYLRYIGVSIDPDLTRSVAIAKQHLSDYMDKGGLPEGIRTKERFHTALVDDIIRKDIVARYRVRYVKEIVNLVTLLISNTSREISYARLQRAVGLKNVHTVSKYVSYIEDSFLIFQINRFSTKLKEQQLAPRKVYCMDTGIVSSLAFATSKNLGYIMENVVAIELRRRKEMDPGMRFFYWKDHQQREVDFVVMRKGSVEQLIQVSYDNQGLDLRDRELSSLEAASRDLGCDNMLIISFDKEGQRGRARMIPLWKWLLFPT
jgi:uncharacterized protein